MLPEFGHYALILALCIAITQVIFPLLGAARGNIAYMQLARYTTWGQFIFIGFSFFVLAYSFFINDFSLAYVAENSNTHLPAIYRFCAVWGAHAGSLLLWVFILSIWMLAVSIFSRRLPLVMLSRVLAVLALISIGFLLFLLTTSDPFIRLLPHFPSQGQSLNPILQDPGLVIHPPMLYMGYVGFSVAFAFALAALMGGQLDATWALWSRPWTTVAWCFLTLGIVLGSWWAYRELGWGGWWFWDPVENASFLPWLVGTALIHSLAVTEKRNVFKAWTVFLAISAFSLSLLGTFLVRSGVLISVHAFAVDPARGLYMLCFLTLVIGCSLLLYAWRAQQIVNTGTFDFFSRESMLLANNVLLFVGMITVLTGTLYPLIINALHLGMLSVGAPYFNDVFVPLMLPLLFFIGIAPLFRWQHADVKKIMRQSWLMLIVVVILAIVLPWIIGVHITPMVVVGLALAFWILGHHASLLVYAKNIKNMSCSQWAMIAAHVGVAVLVVGLTLTTSYSQQQNLRLQLGESTVIGPYVLIFSDLNRLIGGNYTGVQATFTVKNKQQIVGSLYPQLRQFSNQNMVIAKTAINANIFRDIYVVLGNALPDNAWAVRVYYKPFVRWIWAGGLLMVLGGILALLDKRYRSIQ